MSERECLMDPLFIYYRIAGHKLFGTRQTVTGIPQPMIKNLETYTLRLQVIEFKKLKTDNELSDLSLPI